MWRGGSDWERPDLGDHVLCHHAGRVRRQLLRLSPPGPGVCFIHLLHFQRSHGVKDLERQILPLHSPKKGRLSGFLMEAVPKKFLVEDIGHGHKPVLNRSDLFIRSSDLYWARASVLLRTDWRVVSKAVFRFLAPLCNHPRCHYSHLNGDYETYNTKMNGYWCLLIFKEFEEKSHLIFIGWVSILWMSEQLIEIKNYEVNILIFL